MTLLCFWPRALCEEYPRWMPGDFGHVSVLQWKDPWVLIDVKRRGVRVEVLDDDWLAWVTENAVVVKPSLGTWASFPSIFSCVAFAKHAAGVRSRALLPDGLLRDLLRNGAEIVNGRRETPEGNPGADCGAPQGAG